MSDQLFQILLVEDSAADAYLFRKALENSELNFELTVINDGAAALSFILREGKYADSPLPDLAILDLNLPKNDGAEVLQAIRLSSVLANIPVVVATSSASPRERTQAEQLSVEGYIIKPPDLEGFLQIGTVLKEILLRRAGG